MKVEIPETLKADMPVSTWGKILSATPVVMAVLSTLLAGLASSEMTRAQYARSLAAQQQSKAGDQWGFFQAKRLRGSLQRNAADILLTTTSVRPFGSASLRAVGNQIEDPARTQLSQLLEAPGASDALALLEKGAIPAVPAAEPVPKPIADSLKAVENAASDAEIAGKLAKVEDLTLESSVKAARDRAREFDTRTGPVNELIDRLDQLLSGTGMAQTAGAQNSTYRDFVGARLRYSALRYEAEARLNQAIANLLELQVRESNIRAERHRIRSQQFFFGMLGAQAGVIIATIAMAARQRNLLWSLAAAAGLLALAFAIYVYLYV